MVTMELGGNISLSGFSERDFTEMIVIKKIVGQYARKFTDHFKEFSHLNITMKTVHTSKFELVTKAHIASKEFASEVTENNLFVALDSSLKHCWEQAVKAEEKD